MSQDMPSGHAIGYATLPCHMRHTSPLTYARPLFAGFRRHDTPLRAMSRQEASELLIMPHTADIEALMR